MSRDELDSLVGDKNELREWVGDPDTEDGRARLDLLRCVLKAAPEAIELAWQMVAGEDPLPEDVRDKAVEVLLDGGFGGVAHMWTYWCTDPREAIADALDDQDPLKSRFYAAAAESEQARENGGLFDGVICEWDGRVYTSQQEMLQMIERMVRRRRRKQLRRRPVSAARPRSRQPRLRRMTRGPPDDDPGRPSEEPDPPVDDDAEDVS